MRDIFREADKNTDRLAKPSHNLPLGLTSFHKLFANFSLDFLTDSSGHYSSHLVHV